MTALTAEPRGLETPFERSRAHVRSVESKPFAEDMIRKTRSELEAILASEGGEWVRWRKRPFERRLYTSTKPPRSHPRIFSRSRVRPTKTQRSPWYGSAPSSLRTKATRPSWPLRLFEAPSRGGSIAIRLRQAPPRPAVRRGTPRARRSPRRRSRPRRQRREAPRARATSVRLGRATRGGSRRWAAPLRSPAILSVERLPRTSLNFSSCVNGNRSPARRTLERRACRGPSRPSCMPSTAGRSNAGSLSRRSPERTEQNRTEPLDETQDRRGARPDAWSFHAEARRREVF
jgi:hypothetical protein